MHHDLLLGQINLLSWLLANGGDGSIADGAGDLAIHYAAIGDQPLAILTLADKGIWQNFKIIVINLDQSSWRIFFPFYCLFEVKPPYDPVCPSIGRLVVWYVGLTVIMSKKGVKFHFHAPTVAHVILILHYFSKAWSLGSPVNCQNGDKRTPLHLSVINGNMETVRALLKVGASPNAQVNLFTHR